MQQAVEVAPPPVRQHSRSGRSHSVFYGGSVAASRLLAALLISHFAISTLPPGTWYGKGNRWLSGFTQWDSGWYAGIVKSGYSFKRETAFFPGYPLSVRLVRDVTLHSMSVFTSAVVVGWIWFFAAVVLASIAFHQFLEPESARLATLLLAWSPASIFLLAAYPEGMLVALTAVALFYMRRERWVLAALVTGLATSVSPLAIALSAALAVGLAQRFRVGVRQVADSLGLLALSAWGLIAWLCYLQAKFDNALLFVNEQRTFNRSMGAPFAAIVGVLAHIGRAPAPGFPAGNWFDTRMINLGFSLVGLALFLYYAVDIILPRRRRFPLTFSVYACLTAFIPAWSTQKFYGVPNPEAMTRLTCDNLGLYAWMARLLRSRQSWVLPVVASWVALATFIQVLFGNGYYFT